MAKVAPVLFVAVVVELRISMQATWRAKARGITWVVFLCNLYQIVAVGFATAVCPVALYVRGDVPSVLEGIVMGLLVGSLAVIVILFGVWSWIYYHPSQFVQDLAPNE